MRLRIESQELEVMLPTVTFDLKPFCDAEGCTSRYAIREPFIKCGYLCATDGRIAVVIPSTGEPDTTDGMKRPDVPGLILPIYRNEKNWKPFQPWPEKVVVTDMMIDCPDCEGNGIVSGADCKACVGVGARIQPFSCRIDGTKIQVRYERMIRSIPGVEFTTIRDAVLFRATGDVLGMVMKLRD